MQLRERLEEDPANAEAQRALGELLSFQPGRLEEAVRHYARFVDLWKNCDPELRPLVDDAKASIERLKEDPG